MNSLERYLATCKGESPDILPRVPILMAFAAEHIGSNYGAFASDHRILVEANLRCVADFDFDQVSAISDPYRETQGFGGRIRFVQNGVPQCTVAPLTEAKDLSLLKAPTPRGSDRMNDRMKAIDLFKEKVGGEYSILGWIEGPAAEAADLRGVTNFLMDLMDDVPFVSDLMDRCAEVAIAFGVEQVAAGAETIGMGDAIVSQMAPATYEELVLPRQKRIVDAVHDAGGMVRLHICGNITPHLAAIATLGADIVDIDYLVDMKTARTTLPPATVLMGNLDPVAAVQNSTPDRIKADVKAVYEAVGMPFIVGAGCEIPPGTNPDNLKALCAPVPV